VFWDSVTDTIFIVGGYGYGQDTTTNGFLQDVFAYKIATSEIAFIVGTGVLNGDSTAQYPSARYGSNWAYDASSRQLVMYGGDDNNGYRADLWIFHVSTLAWTCLLQNPANSSVLGFVANYTGSSNSLHLLTYDALLHPGPAAFGIASISQPGILTLWAGDHADIQTAALWRFNISAPSLGWQLLSASLVTSIRYSGAGLMLPGYRYVCAGFHVARDAYTDEFYVFGGSSISGDYRNSVFKWTLTLPTPPPAPTSPPGVPALAPGSPSTGPATSGPVRAPVRAPSVASSASTATPVWPAVGVAVLVILMLLR